jgi:hypothetical protein
MSGFNLGEAVLDITGDATGLAKELEGSKAEVESTLGSVGVVAGGIVAAAFAAAVATVAVSVSVLMASITAAMEEEVVQVQTEALIRSTGGAAGLSAEQVGELATSLSEVTRYDDEVIQSGENILLTFTKIGKDVFPRATEAALDMSTTFGVDLTSANRLLGKALQDPIEGMGALERVTGPLSQDLKDQIKAIMGDSAELEKLGKEAAAAQEKLPGLQSDLQVATMKLAEMEKAGTASGSSMLSQRNRVAELQAEIEKANGSVEAFTLAQAAAAEGGTEEERTLKAQNLLLEELEGRFGGTAKAAGQTFAGTIDRIKNKVENLLEAIGKPFLLALEPALDKVFPILEKVGALITDVISSPEAQQFFTDLADTLGKFGEQAAIWFPQIVQWFKDTFQWLMDNQGVIVAALAAIGVAVAALGVVAAIAIWGALAPILPILLVVVAIMAVVAAYAYILYEAWTNNWFGIRDTVMSIWAVLEPILAMLWTWISTTLTTAIQTLANYWTNTLQPAIMAVWSWLSTVLFPFLASVAELISAVVGKAVEALAGLWEKVLYPAIEKVWKFLYDTFNPIIQTLADLFNKTLGPAIQWVQDNVLSKLAGVFDGISDAIQRATGWIGDLAGQIRNLSLPDWLTPGSPTPFEVGLRGIGNALEDVALRQLPAFSYGLNSPALSGAGAGSSESFFPDATFNLGGGSSPDAYQMARQVVQLAGDMLRQQKNSNYRPGG